MQKVIVLRGALAATLAVFILTSASGEARRVHDPDKATKIRTERTTNAPKNNDFRARIDALMKNANEINAPVREDDSPFSVPKTLSEYDTAIIGTPLASQEQCVSYLLSVNPHPAISVSPRELVAYYYEEGAREGIRPDVAFAQALKETGFFRYGGTVTPDQNNYCGLGTTSTEIKGAYFATSQIGVRAHIQHLLAYASTRRPVRPVVDPRYNLVRNVYGTITLGNWQDLNGRWAVPGDSYGQSILSMFRAILRK
ncbi:glucosaminidase domain-containing protein [Selenomonas noxia]|uniref:glucosaminidase domain-containing protein n=1 Tax=Selenomonas noxia TaxID=135083 RepID=UPI0028CFF784|nr:glucosaminidase domain-containing protein [Selenomonas noxia]